MHLPAVEDERSHGECRGAAGGDLAAGARRRAGEQGPQVEQRFGRRAEREPGDRLRPSPVRVRQVERLAGGGGARGRRRPGRPRRTGSRRRCRPGMQPGDRRRPRAGSGRRRLRLAGLWLGGDVGAGRRRGRTRDRARGHAWSRAWRRAFRYLRPRDVPSLGRSLTLAAARDAGLLVLPVDDLSFRAASTLPGSRLEWDSRAPVGALGRPRRFGSPARLPAARASPPAGAARPAGQRSVLPDPSAPAILRRRGRDRLAAACRSRRETR